MATTVASFSAVDDSEIDADSPITETLMKRQRDNPYWIDAGTKKTTVTDTKKILKPDGSGGVVWADSAANGTKGTISTTTLSSTYATITSLTSGILMFKGKSVRYISSQHYFSNFTVTVDLSNDSFTASASSFDASATSTQNSFSGTITTGQQVGYAINNVGGLHNILFRRDSGNLQYSASGAGTQLVADWVII